MVEFEDQAYQLEDEYQDMMAQQEVAEVQMPMPQEQAEYWELTKLHQQQAEMEKKMTGLSHIVKERMKARTQGIPVDLVQRSVEPEVPEKQELQMLSEIQRTKLLVKQGKILRMDRPGTNRGYYLFVKDDTRCMVEQQDEEGNMALVRDTDTNQVLWTDQIMEAEVETYQIPEHDQPPAENDIEMISSTSATEYDIQLAKSMKNWLG